MAFENLIYNSPYQPTTLPRSTKHHYHPHHKIHHHRIHDIEGQSHHRHRICLQHVKFGAIYGGVFLCLSLIIFLLIYGLNNMALKSMALKALNSTTINNGNTSDTFNNSTYFALESSEQILLNSSISNLELDLNEQILLNSSMENCSSNILSENMVAASPEIISSKQTTMPNVIIINPPEHPIIELIMPTKSPPPATTPYESNEETTLDWTDWEEIKIKNKVIKVDGGNTTILIDYE